METVNNLLKQHVSDRRLERMEAVLAERTNYVSLVLENVYYTQNVSAITRSCEGMGIQDMYVIGSGSQSSINNHVALGASHWVSINRWKHQPVSTSLAELKKRGYRIAVTMPADGQVSLPDVDITKGPIAVVLGNEKDGISDEAREMADEFITIPMYGFSDSFNVSVSAATILYDLVTKLKRSDIDWRLTEEYKQELMRKWLKKTISRSDKVEALYEEEMKTKQYHPNTQL